MSLSLLLPEDGVSDLLTTWPDQPCVYQRGRTELDHKISAEVLHDMIDTGCAPAEEIAVMSAGPALNPGAFKTDGRTDPVKLRRLYERGYTIRLGNLQRVVPFLHHVTCRIQEETGYSNYLHAFLTPAGQQGLLHHWDQQMAVIVQLAGSKTWQLWRPPVEAPMREHNESFRVWRDDYIPQWEAAGPDLTVDLQAGQSLLLPRGWVHNPHALDSSEPSAHLTFAIRERTPLWLAEQLTGGAIDDPVFRRIILPAALEGDVLADELETARRLLIRHLEGLSVDTLAASVRQAALTQREFTT